MNRLERLLSVDRKCNYIAIKKIICSVVTIYVIWVAVDIEKKYIK